MLRVRALCQRRRQTHEASVVLYRCPKILRLLFQQQNMKSNIVVICAIAGAGGIGMCALKWLKMRRKGKHCGGTQDDVSCNLCCFCHWICGCKLQALVAGCRTKCVQCKARYEIGYSLLLVLVCHISSLNVVLCARCLVHSCETSKINWCCPCYTRWGCATSQYVDNKQISLSINE